MTSLQQVCESTPASASARTDRIPTDMTDIVFIFIFVFEYGVGYG